MFPSTSRIKLNRVTLKEVIGLRLAPRRRRVPKQKNILVDSTKEKGVLVSEPPRTLQTSQKVPENGAGATKLEDSHEGTQKANRSYVKKRINKMGQTLDASTNEVNPKHREKAPFGAGHWAPGGRLRGAFISSQTAQR